MILIEVTYRSVHGQSMLTGTWLTRNSCIFKVPLLYGSNLRRAASEEIHFPITLHFLYARISQDSLQLLGSGGDNGCDPPLPLLPLGTANHHPAGHHRIIVLISWLLCQGRLYSSVTMRAWACHACRKRPC